MHPTVQEIMKIKRPSFTKHNSVPYCDFGKGLSPTSTDSGPLLVIAWDSIVQIVHFDSCEVEARIDGVYIAESEVTACFFTSESVITILGQNGLKLLNTRKFQSGDHKSITLDNYQTVAELTKHAELDKGPSLLQARSISYTHQHHSDMKVTSYYPFISRQQRLIVVLNKTHLTKVMVYTHEEYLDFIRNDEQVSWLTRLKTSIGIY
jgi:hypothetical protein